MVGTIQGETREGPLRCWLCSVSLPGWLTQERSIYNHFYIDTHGPCPFLHEGHLSQQNNTEGGKGSSVCAYGLGRTAWDQERAAFGLTKSLVQTPALSLLAVHAWTACLAFAWFLQLYIENEKPPA